MELVNIGLLLAGLVLVFFGAALSIYAVSLLGFLIGAGGAYVLAPTVLPALGAEGIVGFAVAVLVGGALGAALSYVALSFATAIPAFVVGAYIGLYVITPIFTDGGLIKWLVMVVAGIVGSVIGFALTKYALMFITSFVGAALASGKVRMSDFTAARESLSPNPILFDPLSSTGLLGFELPLFGILFVLGVLSQIGLFRLGWVTKFASVLPGIGRIFGDSDTQ
jgi:ABC-type multidrug transport system fused ATPase/permease subunit